MKAALITEEQIKTLIEVRNVLKRLNRHNHAEELDEIVQSLKLQEPFGCIGFDRQGTPYFTDPEDGNFIYMREQP